MEGALKGIALEIEDGAYPLVKLIIYLINKLSHTTTLNQN
jgi:hypothetical protein